MAHGCREGNNLPLPGTLHHEHAAAHRLLRAEPRLRAAHGAAAAAREHTTCPGAVCGSFAGTMQLPPAALPAGRGVRGPCVRQCAPLRRPATRPAARVGPLQCLQRPALSRMSPGTGGSALSSRHVQGLRSAAHAPVRCMFQDHNALRRVLDTRLLSRQATPCLRLPGSGLSWRISSLLPRLQAVRVQLQRRVPGAAPVPSGPGSATRKAPGARPSGPPQKTPSPMNSV